MKLQIKLQLAYPVRKSVRTFLAEADRRFHVSQHVVHIRVNDATAANREITRIHTVKAKFHYAILLVNQLASWFASWCATC